MQIITERQPCWDGSANMKVVYNDGGRKECFKGKRAGDCVARSIAIVTGKPYQEVYERLSEGNLTERQTKRTSRSSGKRSARNGIHTKRKWFHDYMESLGFKWVPTMHIGSGCKVHLCEGELPMGKLVVSVSKHMTAVIDGVIHDTYDPQWASIIHEAGKQRIAHRCVYGYYILSREKHETQAA